MLQKGTILNQTYQIIDEIGSGGGGVVYRAKHLRLDTEVVVKRIRDEAIGLISSKGEADILKNLKHTYLPRIYDFIEQEDGIYTVMDYIPGKGLDRILKEQKVFPQKTILKWGRQLGEALEYLHSQKPPVIHSDIKPANIIITPDGDVCLIDFNISTALVDGKRVSLGFSAGYSAPEQHSRTVFRQEEVSEAEEIIRHAMDTYEATELIEQTALMDETTELLDQTEAVGDVTELLEQTMSTDEATELLNPDRSADEATELLEQPYSMDEVTEVLKHPNTSKGMTGTKGNSIAATEKLPGYVDTRSDIYSLGCVLYHLACGVSPGNDFQNIIPLHETNTKVSEGLIVVIEKMMQLDPESRYSDGRVFIEAISNCYKFDKRYKAQHRKENILLATALCFMIAGGVLIGGGLRKIHLERVAEYETTLLKADDMAESGDIAGALSTIGQCQTMDVADGRCLYREIYYLYLSGNYEECISRGEDMIAGQMLLADKDIDSLGDAFYVIGNASYELEDYQRAYSNFSQAINCVKTNELYYRDLCVTLAKLGRIEEAQDALDKATALGMSGDSLYFAQGELYRAKGQSMEAINAFDKVINNSTDVVLKKRAVLLYAQILMDNGKLEEEIELLRNALSSVDNNEELILNEYLATAYMRLGEAENDETTAIKYFDQAAEIFESNMKRGYITWQARENLAILREEAHEFDVARLVLEEMIKDYPKDYRVYKRLAFLEADIQQYKDIGDRDYTQMKEYYDQAVSLYDPSTNEMEMQMLENMINDLQSGGWFDI